MSDEELNYFLWTFKTNNLSLFFEHGFTKTMDANEQYLWLQKEDGFIVPETEVNEHMVYDQNFRLKEETT
jgi:hypothetical protein